MFRPFHTSADDGVSLVKEEYRSAFTHLHLRLVVFKHLLDVLLTIPHPLALNLRNVYLHDVAAGLSCQLQHSLRLARSGHSIKQAGESTTETRFLHTAANLVVVLFVKKVLQRRNLATYALIIKHLFSHYFL